MKVKRRIFCGEKLRSVSFVLGERLRDVEISSALLALVERD